MEDDKDIILKLDKQTAIDLYDCLFGLGEHYAAGAPVPTFDGGSSERLGRVLKDLSLALGGPERLA